MSDITSYTHFVKHHEKFQAEFVELSTTEMIFLILE